MEERKKRLEAPEDTTDMTHVVMTDRLVPDGANVSVQLCPHCTAKTAFRCVEKATEAQGIVGEIEIPALITAAFINGLRYGIMSLGCKVDPAKLAETQMVIATALASGDYNIVIPEGHDDV